MPDEPIKGDLEVTYVFCFENKQGEADTSNLTEAPGDLLVDAGIIGDDRQIVALHAFKLFGIKPQTLIILRPVENAMAHLKEFLAR